MHFKMIIVFVEDRKTDAVLNTARENGATGATIIHNARGEGLKVSKTFFGLSLETQRDVLLMLVEEHLSRTILEEISRAGHFDDEPGQATVFRGIAQPGRVGHVGGQLLLHLLGQALQHRRQEDARRDGHHADAARGQIARHRQGHADHAPL